MAIYLLIQVQVRSHRCLKPEKSPVEHQHPGLGPEHPLLIGSQDEGLAAGHEVGLGGDVSLAIEEEHPQQLAG
jgi:hypothetical protein